jgi:hypothetical protein
MKRFPSLLTWISLQIRKRSLDQIKRVPMQDISNDMIIIDGSRSGRPSSWFLSLDYSRDSPLCHLLNLATAAVLCWLMLRERTAPGTRGGGNLENMLAIYLQQIVQRICRERGRRRMEKGSGSILQRSSAESIECSIIIKSCCNIFETPCLESGVTRC